MDFSAVTARLQFTVADGISVSDGLGDTVNSVGDNIESLIGGMVNNTFTFVGRRSWPADKA